jgi:hypothetical protein
MVLRGSLLTLLIPLVLQPASAPPREQTYRLSVGASSNRLVSGTIWIYSYSWYGLQQHKLADIQNGAASVPLDVDRLKREVDPHPNTDGYVIVIRAGENLWFRTPDIPVGKFWTDFPATISLLGATTAAASGEIQLTLPAPRKRHITFLDPDGRPKTNLDVDVSVYVWNTNHCGFHEGLPLGSFRTDARGAIQVLAPLAPLYLDGLHYYEADGTGPAGPAYSDNDGMKISAAESVVVKEAWELPSFPAQLQVVAAAGTPRPGVEVFANWATNRCGGYETIAKTDNQGIARIDLDATFTALTLFFGDPNDDRNRRELTDTELDELFSQRKLTIRW